MAKRAVHFGAGNIGRGFLGQLYSQSGWETVYVDVVPEVVEGLQREGRFTIHVVGPGACDIPVDHVTAVDGRDLDAVAEAIDGADLLGASVGVNALPHIVPTLAKGLERRAARDAGVDIVICENLLDAGDFLRTRVLKAIAPDAQRFVLRKVGFVESVVSRMIPVVTPGQRAAEPLGMWVEAYDILPVARGGFRNGDPRIDGFQLIDNLHAYEERKLFCHNCMHCLASYFGHAKGYTYVYEAMEDPGVRERARAGGWEAGQALICRHGFAEAEYRTHMEDLLDRFGNRALGDTIARVGGDPVRKLGRRDRLVGAALVALGEGVQPDVLVDGIVAGLRFAPDGDPSAARVQALLAEGGVDRVLTEVCGLAADEPLAVLVRERAAEAGLPA